MCITGSTLDNSIILMETRDGNFLIKKIRRVEVNVYFTILNIESICID